MDWAGRIVRLRAARGWKQAAVAEMLGVDQATVSRWERGLQSPDVAARRRLSRLFLREHPEADRAALLSVEASPYPSLAFAGDLSVVAMSATAASFLGVEAGDLARRGLAAIPGPDLSVALSRAEEAGIWMGAVAAVRFAARPLGDGAAPARFLWTPLLLPRGEIVVASQCGPVTEEEYRACGGIQGLSVIGSCDTSGWPPGDQHASPA